MSKMKRSKGFTLIEIMIVLAILGLLAAIVAPSLGLLGPNSQAKIITDDVNLIVDAARGWKGYRRPYTNITIQALTAREKLPASWGNGTGANPASGNYTVAAANPATRVVITATNLKDSVCLAALDNLMAATVGGNTGSCTTGTLSVTFE